MDCEQARQLFDPYLDGELPPALATELGAHRVRCAECRQALALLEVSEHLIASDPERRELGGDFTNRLLACMDLPDEGWRSLGSAGAGNFDRGESVVSRLRRGLFWVGVSAAAAMVALAFLGVFDRRGESRVAGLTVVDPSARGSSRQESPSNVDGGPEALRVNPETAPGENGESVLHRPAQKNDRSFQEWIGQVRQGFESKRRSVQSLRNAFDRLDEEIPKPGDPGVDLTEAEEVQDGVDHDGSPDTFQTEESRFEDGEALGADDSAASNDDDASDGDSESLGDDEALGDEAETSPSAPPMP